MPVFRNTDAMLTLSDGRRIYPGREFEVSEAEVERLSHFVERGLIVPVVTPELSEKIERVKESRASRRKGRSIEAGANEL